MDGKKWPVLDSQVEYENDWFDVRSELVERPDGETARYYFVDRPTEGVVVVAVHDEKVVLVEQYRPKIKATVLGCPGGAVDPGERPADAGARELREETGYRAGRVKHFETSYLSTSLRSPCHVVFATDLSPGDPDREDGEFIRTRTVPVDEAVATVRESGSTAWTLAALSLAREEELIE